MNVTEKDFEDELEAFRVNAETAAQFFYTFQAIHLLTSRDKTVLSRLNETPMFWNTSLGALREAMFIALGRVFDQDSRTHNIHRLLKIAEDNSAIFTVSAPRWHKHKDANSMYGALTVYKAQPKDWRRLRRYVSNWCKVYETNYRRIRNQVYAHQQRINPDEKIELFQQTNYVELEKLFAFLDAFYRALWALYNGQKPVIRYRRHSLIEMLNPKVTGPKGLTVGELVAQDTQKFLEKLASQKRQSGFRLNGD